MNVIFNIGNTVIGQWKPRFDAFKDCVTLVKQQKWSSLNINYFFC